MAVARLRARVDEVTGLGFTHEELIGQAELREIVPAIADHCVGAIVCRTDGAALPYRTVQAFKRKAASLGVIFKEGARVLGLKRADGVWRVQTDKGIETAPVVVNCAGAWAGRIAEALGEPVPLEVIAPMLMITASMPAFLKPVVGAGGRTLSFKQFANGTVLIGGGHRGKAHPDENRTDLDWERLAVNAKTVYDLFPVMRTAQIVRAWAGIEARMPDDIPVIGPSLRAPRLFHQFGFSAHGFRRSRIW